MHPWSGYSSFLFIIPAVRSLLVSKHFLWKVSLFTLTIASYYFNKTNRDDYLLLDYFALSFGSLCYINNMSVTFLSLMFSGWEIKCHRDIVITKNILICIAIIKSLVKTRELNEYLTSRILDFCVMYMFLTYGIRLIYQQVKTELNRVDYETKYFWLTVFMHIFTVGIMYIMCNTI
jgi:hypothetical protein